MIAYAGYIPALQHAQQVHLRLLRHLPDFVEKQRPAVSLLEVPPPRCVRTGERALLVPEQFAAQKTWGDRPAVHLKERAVAPIRPLMDGVGHGLLARTRFPKDKHRRPRRGRQLDALPDLGQLRAQGQALESRSRRGVGQRLFLRERQAFPKLPGEGPHKPLELLHMRPCEGVVVVGPEVQAEIVFAVLEQRKPDHCAVDQKRHIGQIRIFERSLSLVAVQIVDEDRLVDFFTFNERRTPFGVRNARGPAAVQFGVEHLDHAGKILGNENGVDTHDRKIRSYHIVKAGY